MSRSAAGRGPLNLSQKFSFCRCQGLHASGNLAFVKDFEAFQQQDNEAGRGGARAAIAVDTWEVAGGYLALCPGPASSGLCDRAVWSQVCCYLKAKSPASRQWPVQVWERQVEVVVTLLGPGLKDDLALASTSKFIGSYQLQLEAERELGELIVRRLKVQ